MPPAVWETSGLERRGFLKGAASGAMAAASALAAPAIAQGLQQWRMVTSWPRGLAGVGTGAERLAQRIGQLTGGRITVQFHAAGELVPDLECFDAVAKGDAEIGHDAAYYHIGKTRAAPFFSSVPFGMTADELNAWIYFGGGQALWDEVYAPFGLKPFLAGNTGTQMGGWFRREVTAIADLKGLKVRMPGQGGEVMAKLGATGVTLPGGEIFKALESGAIDAAEWIGPSNDRDLGLHVAAKFYYYPGFHEPGAALQCMVNKARWDALAPDLKAAVEAACAVENGLMHAEYNARSTEALRQLVEKHGVQLRQWPREVLIALGNASGEIVQAILDGDDPGARKVAEAFIGARRAAVAWTRIADQAFANARLLQFKYPGL